MNILIIPSWYSSKGDPNNGVFFREQGIALTKVGNNVTLIDVTFHGRNDFLNFDNFRLKYKNDNGMNVYSLKIPSFYVFSRMLNIKLWIFQKLLYFVYNKVIQKGEKFDIIHAHSFMAAGYCASGLGKMYSIPVVVTEHWTHVLEKRITEKEKKILKTTVESCDKFICVSNSLSKSVNELTENSEKLTVIPNMYSYEFKLNESSVLNNKKIKFLSVGFFNNRKRHSFTISCFEEAFKNYDNVELEIVGTGELLVSVKKQVESYNGKNKINLLGHLNKRELIKKMQECDVFVLASTFENFGVVYIEAMACGKPVIATKNGGANDIVNDKNGILIDVDNREQLIEAFQYMCHNAHEYNAKEIAEDCRLKYSEEAVVKQLNEVYKNVYTSSN